METTLEQFKRYISNNAGACTTTRADKSLDVRSIGDVLVDVTRAGFTPHALDFFSSLVNQRETSEFINKFKRGDIVNVTEGRPSMQARVRLAVADNSSEHTERNLAGLLRAKELADAVEAGTLVGSTGQKIQKIIHIGIGGSFLGPALLSDFFSLSCESRLHVEFVSSLDGVSLDRALASSDPETTMCVVVSQSFSTWETLANGRKVKQWLQNQVGDRAVEQQFFAVTAEAEKAMQWGLSEECVIVFPDGLGGRFSLWSAVSLSVVLQFGWEHFHAFVCGGALVDRNVDAMKADSPLLAMTLFQMINMHLRGCKGLSVSAYNSMLRKVTPWMQQLEMESNGKVWRKDGSVDYSVVAPIVFGQQGTDCQHAYYQMLHQGSDVVPAELIGVVDAKFPEETKYQLANMLAQVRTFSEGAGDETEDAAYRILNGGRPTMAFVLKNTTPAALGTLLALFEYRTILHGHLSGVNSFDQFGVEHGKTLIQPVLDEFSGSRASSDQLVDLLKNLL